MSKTTNNQKFECLLDWLSSKGKAKRTLRGWEIIKPKKEKVLEEIQLESQ